MMLVESLASLMMATSLEHLSGFMVKAPLMDFTIKVNRHTFLVVVPPEIITSSQVINVRSHRIPRVHQNSPWCALVLQLKQPVRWIMNGESFIQSSGV
jgi:hypothetical protein